MYEVVYMPAAKRELEEIVAYIAEELYAPDAALDFIEAVDSMAQSLSQMPYRYPVYHAAVRLLDEVRFVPVKDYNVFYAVDEAQKTVEIRRVLYQRRDMRRQP